MGRLFKASALPRCLWYPGTLCGLHAQRPRTSTGTTAAAGTCPAEVSSTGTIVVRQARWPFSCKPSPGCDCSRNFTSAERRGQGHPVQITSAPTHSMASPTPTSLDHQGIGLHHQHQTTSLPPLSAAPCPAVGGHKHTSILVFPCQVVPTYAVYSSNHGRSCHHWCNLPLITCSLNAHPHGSSHCFDTLMVSTHSAMAFSFMSYNCLTVLPTKCVLPVIASSFSVLDLSISSLLAGATIASPSQV